jgi:hypothetical protein
MGMGGGRNGLSGDTGGWAETCGRYKSSGGYFPGRETVVMQQSMRYPGP